MALKDGILSEFDHEMQGTRKTLERIPEDKFDWKPHEKSFSLGKLSQHLAEIPGWTLETMNLESFDIAPPGAPPPRAEPLKTCREILEKFDKGVSNARAAIAAATDESFFVPWSLLMGGKTVLTLPRVAVLRSFVLSHAIHHRAQLGVYLRLNNVPVPALYGPSADESGM
jgi:uncharacterized damage-inducible protein DinB